MHHILESPISRFVSPGKNLDTSVAHVIIACFCSIDPIESFARMLFRVTNDSQDKYGRRVPYDSDIVSTSSNEMYYCTVSCRIGAYNYNVRKILNGELLMDSEEMGQSPSFTTVLYHIL